MRNGLLQKRNTCHGSVNNAVQLASFQVSSVTIFVKLI